MPVTLPPRNSQACRAVAFRAFSRSDARAPALARLTACPRAHVAATMGLGNKKKNNPTTASSSEASSAGASHPYSSASGRAARAPGPPTDWLYALSLCSLVSIGPS